MDRVLITGSRFWQSEATIWQALCDHVPTGTTLVHGAAKGADTVAAGLWAQYGPVEACPADWDAYGRRAGFIRNRLMVSLGADICLAFIKDRSRGATMCAFLAEQAGIPVVYYRETS